MLNYASGYNFNPYNPMMNAQQRLNQLEQTQFSQGQNLGFRTLPVTNIDEANATQADLSGNPIFFYNKAQNEIYLKQFNINTGLADFKVFKLTANSGQEAQQIFNMSEKHYKTLSDKLDNLASLLKDTEQHKKEVRNAK